VTLGQGQSVGQLYTLVDVLAVLQVGGEHLVDGVLVHHAAQQTPAPRLHRVGETGETPHGHQFRVAQLEGARLQPQLGQVQEDDAIGGIAFDTEALHRRLGDGLLLQHFVDQLGHRAGGLVAVQQLQAHVLDHLGELGHLDAVDVDHVLRRDVQRAARDGDDAHRTGGSMVKE